MSAQVPEIIEQISRLIQAGHLGPAREKCEQVIALEPRNAAANHGLGLIALSSGNFAIAAKHISIALKTDPDDFGYITSLAQAYRGSGRASDAAACYERAILLKPSDASSYIHLGRMQHQQGNHAASCATFMRGLQTDPANPEIQFYLALTLHDMRCYEEAITYLRKSLARQPNHPVCLNNLGNALTKLGRDEEAIDSYRKAIASNPNFSLPFNNLGNALRNRTLFSDALASYQRALDLNPDDDEAFSNILLTLNYMSGISQATIFQESAKLDTRQEKQLTKPVQPFQNVREENKILRLAYISPDFRKHSVAYFTHSLMQLHDRTKVTVFCYSNVLREDERTIEFQSKADHWLSITGMQEDTIAERIREDKIDILVDLAGHTSRNSLGVLARRPAPILVTWLGYPNTTGLRSIDYRITDAIADPPGEADQFHTEKLFRLEHGFLCYQPDGSAPEVSPPPCIDQEFITFGSFNNLAKITPEVVQVWSDILARIPDSRLVLKSKPLGDQGTQSRYLEMFAERGISAKRLDLIGWAPEKDEHMDSYSRVDICLDPFPYNGTTTTCEALWMGVPVISLSGDRHAGRVGTSILHNAGLSEFIAPTVESLIALAESLSGDTERLIVLRQGLRERLSESTLMNCQLFTETLENAYREMWSTWCKTTEM
ncbi:MAG: hypothetical protein CL797_08925 [Chromatiales bacterium]|jgi:predicted O-linked N-acetylglucosamine transferase (SPINDLY family)|nr:hypothetical protein [Chromatiales bacterium]